MLVRVLAASDGSHVKDKRLCPYGALSDMGHGKILSIAIALARMRRNILCGHGSFDATGLEGYRTRVTRYSPHRRSRTRATTYSVSTHSKATIHVNAIKCSKQYYVQKSDRVVYCLQTPSSSLPWARRVHVRLGAGRTDITSGHGLDRGSGSVIVFL